VDGVPLVASLAASLVEIERRHEPLRTVLREVDGGPVQQVLPPSASGGAGRLPVVDLTGLTGGPRSSRALEAATRRASRRRLDLEGETPPWRALLLRTGERRHRLLLVIHHAACDDRAIVVLLEELATLVRAHRAGEDLATVLPELPVRYTDYARWQHRETRDGRLDGPLRDWLERLEGFRAGVEPPADRRPPKVPDHRGDRCTIRIPGDRAEALRRFARDERASVFTVLLAAFGALIARSTGSDDVVVTSPATGRERLELEGLIGVFVNSVPLRLELGGDPGFREVVARARETVLGALAHQEVPFDRLIEELRRSRPGRGDDADSLRGVVLAYRGRDRLLEELAPGLRLRVEELGNGTAKNGLTLFAVDGEDAGGGLELTAELATALYDVSTVRRLLSHLRVLLEGVLADPDRRLAELPLLTAAERHQVLVEANDTVVPGRVRAPEWRVPTTLQGLFAAQAARTPDRVAVSDGARQVTFAALARAAASVSARLRARGVGAEDRVGFCIERSPEMVVAALGILGAGAAFVPLDPSDPAERLAFMLRTAGTGALITVPRLAGAFAPFVRGLTMTVGREIWRERERVAGPEPGPPPEGGDPEHLAYVIFTSGSTGGPKGVMIQQRAIWHRLAWEQRVFPLGEADRVLQKTPVTFDPSLWELFLPLAVGARMELAAPGEHRDTASLAATVAARRITALQLVPSQLALLVELVESDGAGRTGGAGPALFAGFPRLFCGGEALPAELARRWAGLVPEVPLYNFYGPAEAAIDVTFGPASGPAAPAASTVSIGRSLDDVAVYLVDRHLEPVPLGQPGELVVAGDHVGRGYVDRPGMTAERFVPDPFPSPDLSSRRGALLYRTGDLARRLPDGRIEFLGRLDHQVKIRGRRIELGEVEAALAALPGVARAAAAVAGTGGERRLVGYLVPAAPDRAPAPSPGSPERYREILARSLPEVMIPSVFVLLDALPRTPSGKVDRRALPAPDASALGAATAFRPPETSLERRIAALWGELLGVERVGRDDDFFALGGHSLLATRMLFRLRREPGGGPELPLAAVFERRTVAGLAAEIESLGGAPAPGTPAISASPGPVSAGIPGAIPRRRRAPNVRLTDDGEVLAVDEPPRGD
jgi:amino acid adenylation domain-containing protein